MSSFLGRVRLQSGLGRSPLRGNGRTTAANGEKVTVALDAEVVARTRGALGADDTPHAAGIERK